MLPAWALSQLLVTSSTTHKQIGPFSVWVPGGWVCVHSRILWVSPTNCPVSLAVSPSTSTPTGTFSQRFWGFISLCWDPGCCGLSHSPVVPPSLYAHKCGTTHSGSHCLTRSTSHHLTAQVLPCHKSALPWLPVSTAPTSLDDCFFFNSLVVGLPYSLIFWQFWLFFVFKFVVVFLLVVWGSKVCLPMPPSWLEVS